MALVGGTGAALVIATLPHVYLENLVGFTGLSEIISAAAPPLGNTARGLIAIMAGLVSASAIYFFLNRKGDSDMSVALREQINSYNPVDPDYDPAADERKSRFSMPKFSLNAKSLTRFLKKPKKKDAGPKKVMDLADLPMLRESDAHPDAPARRPIFAESDLGSPLASQIQPLQTADMEQEEPASQNVSPAPFSAERSIPAPLEEEVVPQAPVTELEIAEQPVAVEIATPLEELPVEAPEDLSSLTIAQLADRLESGLNRLKQIENATSSIASVATEREHAAHPAEDQVVKSEELSADSPPPLKPVEKSQEQLQAERQADMDAALKAALGTLEKMTAQR